MRTAIWHMLWEEIVISHKAAREHVYQRMDDELIGNSKFKKISSFKVIAALTFKNIWITSWGAQAANPLSSVVHYMGISEQRGLNSTSFTSLLYHFSGWDIDLRAHTSPSEIYPAGKLQWHFSCGFDFDKVYDCYL